MFREVLATMRNRSFIALLVMSLLMSTANGAKNALEIYINIYFWELNQGQMAILASAAFIGIIGGVILTPRLTRVMSKRNAAACMLLAGVAGSLGPVLARLAGLMPPNGSPVLFYILFVDAVITLCVVTATAILMTSMLNDVVEDVEVKTGRRSEGLLLAADTLCRKIVSSAGVLVSGIMLTIIAFPQNATPGDLAPGITIKLAYAYFPMMILYILSFSALFFYRIDRQVHEANLAILEARQTD